MANSSVFIGTPGVTKNSLFNRYKVPAVVIAVTETSIVESMAFINDSIAISGDQTANLTTGTEVKLETGPFNPGYAFVISSSYDGGGNITNVNLDLTNNGPGGWNVPNLDDGISPMSTPIFNFTILSFGINYGFAIAGGVNDPNAGGGFG